MSPRKIGAVSKSVWKDFFSAIRPPPKPFGNASRPEKELPVPALQGPDLPTRDDRAGPPEPPPGALPGPSPESELPAPGGEATDGLATEPTPAVSGDQPSAPKMEVKTEDVEEASTGTITPPASPRTIAPAPAQPKGKGKGKGAKGKAPVAKAKPKASTARTSLPKAPLAAGSGMSELLQREIGDIDLSQIDPSAARERVTCPRCEKEVLAEHLESHMTAHSSDTAEQDILSELPGALEFIHQAKLSHEQHHVLVNCAQGVSRSASVTIAYLIQPFGPEFLNQLGTFECQIFGFATPSLTGEEIFAHRTLLNVDDVTLNTHTPAKATSSTPQELSEASTNAMDSDEAASFYCRRLCYAAVASKAPKGKGKGKRPPPPKAKAPVAPRDVEVTSRAERSCSVSELKQTLGGSGYTVNNRDPDSSNDSEEAGLGDEDGRAGADEISNHSKQRPSVMDWYESSGPPAVTKSTSEWYLDGSDRFFCRFRRTGKTRRQISTGEVFRMCLVDAAYDCEHAAKLFRAHFDGNTAAEDRFSPRAGNRKHRISSAEEFTGDAVRGILREMAHDGMLQFLHAACTPEAQRTPEAKFECFAPPPRRLPAGAPGIDNSTLDEPPAEAPNTWSLDDVMLGKIFENLGRKGSIPAMRASRRFRSVGLAVKNFWQQAVFVEEGTELSSAAERLQKRLGNFVEQHAQQVEEMALRNTAVAPFWKQAAESLLKVENLQRCFTTSCFTALQRLILHSFKSQDRKTW
eukprot:g16942.t1